MIERENHQGREREGREECSAPSGTGDFKIGYARITQFNKPTADDLDKKLDELEKRRGCRRSCSICATTPADC